MKPKEKLTVESKTKPTPIPKKPVAIDVPVGEDTMVKEAKIHKDFIGLDGKKYRLTYQQRMFVENYITIGGNRVQAIVNAGYDVYYKDKNGEPTTNVNSKLASVMACKLLKRDNVSAYVIRKMKDYGLDDDSIDRQHLYLLNQMEDLNVKAKAIDMYYKKRGLYSVKVEHGVDKLDDLLTSISKLLP